MDQTRALPTRRALMRGATWATPVVAVSMTAPAYAASTTCISVDLAVGQTATLPWDAEWEEVLSTANFVDGTGTLAGAPRSFNPSGGSRCYYGRNVTSLQGVTNAKVGERDPRVNGASFAYRRAVCFAPGTYELRYYAAAYRGNPVTAYMTPSVLSSTVSTVALGSISGMSTGVTAHGFVDPTTGSGTNAAYVSANLGRTQYGFRFTVDRQGTFTFQLTWSFGRIATDSSNTGRLRQTNAFGDSCIQTYANDIAVEAPVIRRIA